MGILKVQCGMDGEWYELIDAQGRTIMAEPCSFGALKRMVYRVLL